ncbi:unnamed protein product, partial [Vitis vinifera]|uniref:Uncharacterized protein n=1 Tax=Vitis vinifera TaxID=29760 RepID=D7UDS0_VITVI
MNSENISTYSTYFHNLVGLLGLIWRIVEHCKDFL